MPDEKLMGNEFVTRAKFYNTKKTGKVVIHIKEGINVEKVIRSSLLTIESSRRGKPDVFSWAFDTISLMRKRATGSFPKLKTGPNRISLPLPIELMAGDTLKISRIIKGRIRREIFVFNKTETTEKKT